MQQTRPFFPIIFFIISLFILMNAQPAYVADSSYIPSQQLTAEHLTGGDQYGFAMAADNRWLVIGAKSTDLTPNTNDNTGVVYIYHRNKRLGQWDYYQTLQPWDLIPHSHEQESLKVQGAEFGESIALYKNRIAIGARFALSSAEQASGKVYTYRWRGHRSGWVKEAVVEPDDGEAGDEFGRSVSLDRQSLIVGARFAKSNTTKTGAVYVYERQGQRSWNLQQKIVDQYGKDGDEFGRAVAMEPGGHLVIGSRKATTNGTITPLKTGAVFVYKPGRHCFKLLQVLTPDETIENTEKKGNLYFGQSVAINRNTLVVGVRNADTAVAGTGESVLNTGAAYVYRLQRKRKLWQLEQILQAGKGTEKAQYGFSVALSHLATNRIAIGARKGNSITAKKSGTVYIYEYDQVAKEWLELQQLSDQDLAAGDEFGQSLAMDPINGSWIVIGADQFDPKGIENAGAAFGYSSLQ